MRRFLTISVFLALVMATAPLAQAGQHFRYKFEQGDKLVYEMRVKSKGSTKLPGGRSSSFFFDSKTTVELKCIAVMGETYRVAVRVSTVDIAKIRGLITIRTQTGPCGLDAIAITVRVKAAFQTIGGAVDIQIATVEVA